jgi:hypothetical protein
MARAVTMPHAVRNEMYRNRLKKADASASGVSRW